MNFTHTSELDERQFLYAKNDLSEPCHTISVPIVERPAWADNIAHLDDGTPHNPADPSLRISRSHAGGLTLHARQYEGLLGVDMVALNDLRTEDIEALVSLTRPQVSPEEIGIRSLHNLGVWWAATEAAAKAWGGGLPLLIERFQIALSGASEALILRKDDALPPLRFYPLVVKQDLIGILATDGPCRDVSLIAYEQYPFYVSSLTRSFSGREE